MESAFLVFVALALAFANGANDVFKGVATLYGSRTLGYRIALAVAVVSTLAGALLSVVLAGELVRAFSGKGLVPDAIVANPSFAVAVGLGAALTILSATAIGFPISTTHALTGALVGGGLVGAASELNVGALGTKFAVPLLVSPFLALGLTGLLYPFLRWLRLRLGVTRETWIRLAEVEGQAELVPVQAAIERGIVERVAAGTGRLELSLEEGCLSVERYQGTIAGVSAERLLNAGHVFSASAVGFARGLNDTPKIAALLLLLPALGSTWGNALVGVVMVVGGIVGSRKVAEKMSNEITTMNAGQGFTGNMVSALLVTVASRFGVPVSTTHVTCGAIFGIGLATRQARLGTIGQILLAWVTTLPVAAALAALTYWALT
jgi:inorganic phosphate transporter, PiT family